MTPRQIPRLLIYQNIPVWRHSVIIQWAAQLVSALIVVALVVWFFANIAGAIQDRNISYSFAFLAREYQTPISDFFIPYASSDTFLYALWVAITNTLVVAVSGVILATLLGIIVGVARLSTNWIVANMAMVYIEFFRNVPLLVQLYFWLYIVQELPSVRDPEGREAGAIIPGGLYVYNDGISLPWPVASDWTTPLLWLTLAVASVVVGRYVYLRLSSRETETGRASYPVLLGSVTAFLLAAFAWLILSQIAGESPFAVSTPEPQGRFGRIAGGLTAKAGLMALLVGLVIYTSSFIAEIVRAGIQSVGRGQIEAARALALSPLNSLRHVAFPQALRVIIPPLISQSLNLTKNSSLGGAIGYAELTSVAVTMTQTAPAIPIFILVMASYLAMSLTWSLVGNLYNRHIRFVGA
jgi:general L-amino acid transport system permease protein